MVIPSSLQPSSACACLLWCQTGFAQPCLACAQMCLKKHIAFHINSLNGLTCGFDIDVAVCSAQLRIQASHLVHLASMLCSGG